MQAWEQFIALQEKELGEITVRKWVKTLKILRFDACNIYLEAKDAFQALWLEEHILPKAKTQLVNNNNRRVKVHLSIQGTSSNDSSSKPVSTSSKSSLAKPTSLKSKEKPSSFKQNFTLNFDTLDPHCLFSNFVANSANELPIKLLQGLGENLNELGAFNPIYIHGDSGSGKTHLLMATADLLMKKGLKVVYTRADTFTEHVVTAIRAGEMGFFRNTYRNADVLIVDDVQVFGRKAATQEEFFHTFNSLHVSGKQIILSSNSSPMALQSIEPRLISRFEWGIVLPLEKPSPEEIGAIIDQKARAFDFDLPQKIKGFLIQTFKSGVKSAARALEALILRLHYTRKNASSPQPLLSVAYTAELLADLIKEEEQNALSAQKITSQVAEFFGITVDDILGKAQSRECVLPRQICMYLIRNMLKLSFIKIGDLFKRDHSTVMSSVKLIAKAIENNDEEILSSYQPIIRKLNSKVYE